MKHIYCLLAALLLVVPVAVLAGDDDSLADEIEAADLSKYVRNSEAAIALGKALFWDAQAGSDGVVACATCHFSAGADTRSRNQLNPGANGTFDILGVDATATLDDFPIMTDDVFGSQGVEARSFTAIDPGNAVDIGAPVDHPVFGHLRQTTGRNSPSAVNAVTNEVQFWDGRAKNEFNGVTGGGSSDRSARVLKVRSGGRVKKVRIAIENASLASQAVGPPLSAVEMSWDGRDWLDIGKKMLALEPLAGQEVHPNDSVLGDMVDSDGKGLDRSYADLIRTAFKKKWWDSDAIVDRNKDKIGNGTPSGLDEFSVMEANFSLFWGLAIHLYESTLVSDQTLFDRGRLSAAARRGFEVFEDDGRCDKCHDGPTFHDGDFNNIGVRPAAEDLGRGDGEFKTPTLRNVELNGPYMHNGGFATLRQVVEFYNRGGDFPDDETDSQIRRLGLSDSEIDDLVAFMIELTDERVRRRAAPFDHPELEIPNGPHLAAVGADGTDDGAITTFLEVSPFDGGSSSAMMAGLDQIGAPDTEVPSTRSLADVREFDLQQNTPNPFPRATRIRFAVPHRGYVSVSVYNALGQRVRTLVDGVTQAGSQSVIWQGRNDSGQRVESGVYFVKMIAPGFSDSKKLVMLD